MVTDVKAKALAGPTSVVARAVTLRRKSAVTYNLAMVVLF